MGLIQMADSIHKLQERLQQLQSEVLDISIRKSVGNEELEDLHEEVEAVQAKLNLVNKTFNMKYEELKEVCSQLQMLQNYVEQFKNNQDYKELEVTVRSEVGCLSGLILDIFDVAFLMSSKVIYLSIY